MKRLFGVLGVLFIISTIVLAILYVLKVEGIELGYCMVSMIACFLTFGARRMLSQKE